MANVCHAEANLYTCSDTNQQHIKNMIAKHRLNRLVVSSCSPRTHEMLFQETLRESGLNQYLFAMTNIRDQCSWVHKDDPEAATGKALELTSMAVARARHLKALPTGRLPVTPSALLIGGGLAGMTAALGLADQGFEVHLAEKEPQLGGMLRGVHRSLEGADVQAYLNQLVARVQAHEKIHVYLSSTPAAIAGHVGNFKSVLRVAGREKPISHGVVIVAVGGQRRSTELYLHGQNPHVTTQSQLEASLEGGNLPPELAGKQDATVVMIQCVESRNEKNPYCSRICCSEAVRNALEIKRRLPRAKWPCWAATSAPTGSARCTFRRRARPGCCSSAMPRRATRW